MDSSNRFTIDRPIYQHNTIDETFNERKQSDLNLQNGTLEITDSLEEKRLTRYKKKVYAQLGKRYTQYHPKTCLLSTFPCLVWLAHYNWKEDLAKDVIAGFTVAIMNIPQGMAYALLADVSPVVGLYMAIFPVLIYVILGTSRHCAMGSFAVISLMSGKVVRMYAINAQQPLTLNATMLAYTIEHSIPPYKAVEVASAICFLVGIYQLIMYLLRLGNFSSFLSDILVNAFTAGAAVHVFTSQLKDLLGMKVQSYSGNFQLIYTYISMFKNLGTINIAACVVSFITITILVLNNKFLKPWVSKKTIIPVPIELICLLLGTVAAQYFGISKTYNLSVVGSIAVGLPAFKPPPMTLLSVIALDSFVIAVVAYVISISMALIFAHKLNYEIDANQELLAQGAGNLFGSFFSCLPFCASLSRSVIQQSVGGRTQLCAVVCAAVLIGVLTSFAKIFEPLPRAILAGLIIVALRGLLSQIVGIVHVWKLSARDGILWIVTYLTVILVEVDIGLLVGFLLSNLMICFRGVRPKVFTLARLPNTEIYVDPERYTKSEKIIGVCIIRFGGSLNFTNQAYFKEQVYKHVNRNPKKEYIRENLATAKVTPIETQKEETQFIILDLSAVQFVDLSGASSLLTVAKEFSQVSVPILLAGTPGSVYDTLTKCGVFKEQLFTLFPTVHDAVLYTESKRKAPQNTKF